MRRFIVLLLGALLLGLPACGPIVPHEAFLLTSENLAQRRLETRRFDTNDESRILQSSLALLQDLGFSVDESESRLGVIVASKRRDATDAASIIGSIAASVFFDDEIVYDSTQTIRASLVTRPLSANGTAVRITFQRTVWDNRGVISRSETIHEPAIYQEFFSKLSKSVFLDAQGI
jgi:hypothetical protein